MFIPMSDEQYRSLDAASLEARRQEVIAEVDNPGSEVDAAQLRSEAECIRREFERRNQAVELRNLNMLEVINGGGSAIERNGAAGIEHAERDLYDTPEYRNAFMAYVTRGVPVPMELRADAHTATEDVPVMIPTTLMNKVVEKMSEYGTIWNRVTKINVKGGIEYPVLDLKPTASWIGENDVSEYQKFEADEKISFLFYQLECRLSQTILAATVTFDAFQARFVPLVAEAMVRALEQAIIRGTGTGQFLGITVDPRVTNVVELTEAEFSNWKAWRKKVKAKMPKSYRKGEFIMAQSTFDSYIETMSDDNNAPVSIGYNPVTGEEESRLMGKHVETVEPDILPDFDTASAGDVVAIFGDLSNYVVNSQMQVNTVRWIDHDTNKVKTKAMLIADGKVLDPYGFILIKKKATGSTGSTGVTGATGATS